LGQGLTTGGGTIGGLGKDSAQMGLLGAPPLSTHPLLGGSGPSMGMGLMHAEQLPGSGQTGARTSMMGQFLEKPGGAVMAPAGAGAGTAGGGAAPLGAGAGGQSGASARPGLAPVALAREEEEEGKTLHYGDQYDVDDGDDW
jgi:hypothetical protein